jgi:hypothetical protein
MTMSNHSPLSPHPPHSPAQPPGCFVHQIFYDTASRQSLSPEFIPLDNVASPRPEWFEFWPVRQYLMTQSLQEDAWYGFLSPKFTRKFGLTADQLLGILDQARDHEDVVLVSPHWDQAAYFLNAFEQGELWTPGLLDASQRLIERAGIRVDLRSMVASSRTTVFSNYLVAKPVFWRKWLDLANLLFQCSERSDDPLWATLNAPTSYHAAGGRVPMKVFVQERLACVVLAQHALRVGVIDLSDAATVDQTLFVDEPSTRRKLQICDTLKQAYLDTRDPEYLSVYRKFRAAVPTVRPVPA